MKSVKKNLSANGLLNIVFNKFKKIRDPIAQATRSTSIGLTDCLMSAVAMFGMKFPSLLKFDEGQENKVINHNLKTLYHVENAPSDTTMRERLDEVDPSDLRSAYKNIFSAVQRGNALQQFQFLLKDHYLVAGDGTGFFASPSVHCDNCCMKHYGKCRVSFKSKIPKDPKKNTYLFIKTRENGYALYAINAKLEKTQIKISDIAGLSDILKKEEKPTKQDKKLILGMMTEYHRNSDEHSEEHVMYYHNMYCAAIVHPYMRLVLPFAPEPIMKADGDTKNDCERNAAKRFFADTRREHPHLKLIVVEDSLASNVPHLTDLKNQNMRYIVGAKEGDHAFLFDLVSKSNCTEHTIKTDDGATHFFRYINQVQLNKSHRDFQSNFVEYVETDKNNNTQYFSWVTDIEINNDNVYDIMRGGRSNWKIENHTFNTLKNQNYHFSHNFGHGNKNLCTVFGMLLMLAFYIDQVQELSCFLFKKSRAKFKSRTSLWENMKALFMNYLISSWEDLYNGIAHGHNEETLIPNTS